MSNTKRKITLMTRIGYGSTSLVGSGPLGVSGAWLLFFYTTFCNLSIVQATAIFSLSTYLDVITNPIMGFITDNFYQTKLGRKFGRRRFFILLGIPLMLLYPMLWVSNMGFLYYLTTYILFEIAYTSIMIPYETLPAEMTNDFNKRTSLVGFKTLFGNIANFLAASIPGVFFAIYGQNTPLPFFLTGVSFCIIMMISLILLYFNSWEKSFKEVKQEKIESLFKSLKKLFVDILSTFRVKTFRIHLGMYIFGFGSQWLFAAVFTYFIVFVLKRPSAFVASMNSLSSIIQLVATTVFIALCLKKGFKRPNIAALCVSIATVLAYIGIYILHMGNLTYLVVGITILFGFAQGGIWYIPWTVYVFLADVDEVVTGRRRDGIYAGAMTMAGKLIRASIVFVLGMALSMNGFVKGAHTQPDSAVNAIIGVMAIGVCGMALLAIIFSKKLKLDHKSHKILIEELNRIKNGGRKEDVTAQTKQVIEELTGFKYENCFGNNSVGYKEKSISKAEGKLADGI